MSKQSLFVRSVFLGFLALTLSACSSKSLIKTYEGSQLPKEEVTALIAGENMTVLSVNGQPVPQYLLSTAVSRYGLKPGENKVRLKYTSVWATAPSAQEDSRAVTVESDPVEMIVDARAGETLSFSFEQASDIREARELASTFKASLLNAEGEVVARSYRPESKAQVVSRPVALDGKENTTVPAENPKAMPSESSQKSPLSRLKHYWEKASAEERQQFLKWAL